jgi:transposase
VDPQGALSGRALPPALGGDRALDAELEQLVAELAPSLLAVYGCATLTAAENLGETADIRRFRCRSAYAHNGTVTVAGLVTSCAEVSRTSCAECHARVARSVTQLRE